MVNNRRSLRMEILENREMLTISGLESAQAGAADFAQQQSILGPSADEQEMLELINRMRMDPQGELNRLIKSFTPFEAWDPRVTKSLYDLQVRASQLRADWAELTPAAPLAWNSNIAFAASGHNYLMMRYNTQSHQIQDPNFPYEYLEPPLYDRLINAGFDPAYKTIGEDNFAIISENVYSYGLGPTANFSTASYSHAAFAIDWGVEGYSHRVNIMNPDFTDIGISMMESSTNPGYWLTTADFGASASTASRDGSMLVGVVFDDFNSSGYYEAGEGLAEATITITNLDADDETEPIITSTLRAGGYQIYLENGNYSISVSGPGFGRPITKYASIQGSNVKVDFIRQEVNDEPPILDLNGSDTEGIDYLVDFYENGESIKLVPDFATLTDIDSNKLSSAIITLTNRPDGSNEFLDLDTNGSGLKSTYDSATGVLLLFGDAPLEDYLHVLQSLEYGNVSEKADLSDRIINIVVSDGVNQSDQAQTTVRIVQQTLETLTISDVQIEEGDERNREMVFWLDLSDVPRHEVIVQYAFLDGTAVNGVNYYTQDGTLTIRADQTSARIIVQIPGDYLPGEDLNFTLNITNIQGASCPNPAAIGTIWDDDTPLKIGQVSRWNIDDVDLTDGRRRLIQFSPGKTGTVVWESLISRGHPDDVEMILFQGNHDGVLLTESFDKNGRSRIEWDVEQGELYTLSVRGDVFVDSLRMAQTFVVKDNVKNKLDIIFDGDGDDEFIIVDPFHRTLQYAGVYMPSDYLDYDNIGFQNVPGNYYIIIITPDNFGDLVVDPTDPDFPEFPDFPVIDISEFEKIEYEITDDSTVVQLQGSAEDDVFYFKDGVATFTVPSLSKHYTVRGAKILNVDGGGGLDYGLIYDTKEQDHLDFGSDSIFFAGGGDTGYRITLDDFTWGAVYSYYGGNDVATVTNANGSRVFLSSDSIQRVQFDSDRDVNRQYFARGFYDTTVYNSGEEDNRIVLGGSTGRDIVSITPEKTVALDEKGTYIHTIYGKTQIELRNRNDEITVFYDSLSEIDLPSWTKSDKGRTFSVPSIITDPDDPELILNFTNTIVFPDSMMIDWYFDGKRKEIDFAASAIDSFFSQPDIEQELCIPTKSEARYAYFEVPEIAWTDVSRKELSLTDLALIYDWGRE